ncbi:MAG: transporter permease [Aeromicrobium sp.]|jgi:ABC-2 type transport system permease protein|nr:transporter permease [Aeromicrobium sp.]
MRARTMTPFGSLARAMLKGFFRDRMSVFFAIVFPLMFLVLFGGLLTDQGVSRSEIIQIGAVPVLDDADPATKEAFDASLEITRSSDEPDAVAQVRKGDADAVISQDGDRVTVRYSAADQVKAATVRGTFEAVVQAANLATTGQPPTFSLDPRQVEDESLSTIQFVTPGLLGWAVAMSATIGAASNLVVWRRNGLLRRLRLAPVRTPSVVLARVAVSLMIAAVQTAIFLGLGMAAFGLELSGSWPMIVPLLLSGTLAFMSIGLLAGSIARTEEGAIGMANFVVLPMAFLSGSFFPLDDAPAWLRGVGEALPLRHLNEGMLDTMVRGEGPASTIAPIAILLGFAIVLTAVSARVFRWDA